MSSVRSAAEDMLRYQKFLFIFSECQNKLRERIQIMVEYHTVEKYTFQIIKDGKTHWE